MSRATIKKGKREAFLKPLHSFDDLLKGKQFIVWNGQLLYKNGNGYVLTNISKDENYTREDYMKLPEGAPFQLIQGKLTHMASPKIIHQRISWFLSGLLFNFLNENPIGEAFAAPMDVHFNEKNIFQPDLLFVSNERANIIQDWIQGAPDLIIEIISPGTKKMDRSEKKEVYGKYGVKEYWLIDPENKTLEFFENIDGKMVSEKKLKTGEVMESKILKGFRFEIAELFK